MFRSRPDKPRVLSDALLRRWRLPQPAEGGSKEARGRVLVIAGAVEMPGAAILASTAALRAGAGKVRVATAEAAAMSVATAVPELFVIGISETRRDESLGAIVESAKNTDVVLIGPGMRDAEAIRFLLPKLVAIESLRALVIDASALPMVNDVLPGKPALSGKTIITPHAGEMSKIANVSADDIAQDPLRTARETARRLHSIVVLKGAETTICGSDGAAFLNRRRNVGLATAGSGDVLAGVIAGLCARGADPIQAAAWGVFAHARAGEQLAKRIAPLGYLARELLNEIPRLTNLA